MRRKKKQSAQKTFCYPEGKMLCNNKHRDFLCHLIWSLTSDLTVAITYDFYYELELEASLHSMKLKTEKPKQKMTTTYFKNHIKQND